MSGEKKQREKKPRRVLADQQHPEYASMREWAGDYDAARFSPGQVKFDNPKKRWDIACG